MNIVVVGAGAIGKERIKALKTLGENIIGIVDPSVSIKGYKNYETYNYFGTNVDWFFISVPHDEVLSRVIHGICDSKNMLVEKPLGRDIAEYNLFLERLRNNCKVNIGFNYRFYKGVNQLLIDCKNKLFGDLISVNMILALGDAPGTEKTWRLDPKQAGRGAILDPGIHLIDLAMIISDKSLQFIASSHKKGFWNTGIEEESHVLAVDENGTIYNIQASKVRWRNTFRIEVNGTEGYGIVEGRNRNYGNQTYRRGKRWGWQSGKSQRDSEEMVVNYDGEDSFLEETRAVLYGTDSVIKPATHEDNRRCLEFIEQL